jgi:hypothetical protein
MLSCQTGGNGAGGVAVGTVAGVVVAAGGAGIFVAGVVLHVAQGGAGVQGEGDRTPNGAVSAATAAPTRRPGRAGQAAYQLPQVALTEPTAGDGGQQRTVQLTPLAAPARSARSVK